MGPLDVGLLKVVSAHPGATVADATRDLLVGYTTTSKIRYHLNQLERAGLIEQDRSRVAGRVFVTITKQGREILAQ